MEMIHSVVCFLFLTTPPVRSVVWLNLEKGQGKKLYSVFVSSLFCFSLNCQVVVVPSSRDAHHHPVYPQGPFVWKHQPQVPAAQHATPDSSHNLMIFMLLLF